MNSGDLPPFRDSVFKDVGSFSAILPFRHSTVPRTKRDFLLRKLVFKTKCRPAVDDGNLLVNADNPCHSEPFAKLLK